jgi:hypothetical protein
MNAPQRFTSKHFMLKIILRNSSDPGIPGFFPAPPIPAEPEAPTPVAA